MVAARSTWLTDDAVVPMLGYLYFDDNKGKVPTVSGDIIKASLSMGMICGQILFGLFGDALGRHRIYGKELILTLTGTMLVILMPWGDFSHSSVVAWMSVFRVLTGFGTGGGQSSHNCHPRVAFNSICRLPNDLCIHC